jgi:hypothetical protein
MISGTTSFCGTTGFFSVKNENAQTRAVIMEKHKKPEVLPMMEINGLSLTGGTRVYGSQVFSGVTTMNFFTETHV